MALLFISCSKLAIRKLHLSKTITGDNICNLMPMGFKLCTDNMDINNIKIYEDSNFVVLYKPPSILSQSGLSSNHHDNVFSCYQESVRDNASINAKLVHRIDRPCSGVMVIAKSKQSASQISSAFQKRSVKKKYLCVVNGTINGSGQCTHMLSVSSSAVDRKKDGNTEVISTLSDRGDFLKNELISKVQRSSKKIPNRKIVKAQLFYNSLLVIKRGNSSHPQYQTLIEVVTDSGRKHQIRAQLAAIGLPICGDKRYGAPQAFRLRDICLHAYYLSIPMSKFQLSSENNLITDRTPQDRVDMNKKFVKFTVGVPRIWEQRFGAELTNIAMRRIEDSIK